MTEDLSIQAQKPDDKITVTVNDQEVEVFMSGGLIRTLVPYYMNSTTTTEIFSEVLLQNDIIVECVRPRNKSGQVRKNYTIEDFEITPEDSNKLVAWVTEHVLYFFIDSMTSVQDFSQRNKPQIQTLMRLMQSPVGLPDLQGQNASAGPST